MIPLLLTCQAGIFLLVLALGFRAARNDPDLNIENALRRSPRLIATSLLLVGLAAVTLSMQFYDPFCLLFPLVLQLYATWASWLILATLFGVVSGYGLSLALARGHRQSRSLSIAVLLLQVAIALPCVRLLSPIASDLGAGDTRGGVVIQTHSSTCAAASLANIARHFEFSLDEKGAAELLLTTLYGTSPGQMRFALEKLGISFTTLDPSQLSLAAVPPPAVLFVDHHALGRESHAVAYFGLTDDGYEIADPLIGVVVWDEESVGDRWHGNGISCFRR